MSIEQRNGSGRKICIRCGMPVREEDGWWVDDNDDLTCWDKDNPDDLGPHEVFADAEEETST